MPHTHPDRLLCVCGERRKGLKRRRRRKGDWEYPGCGHLGVRGHPQMLPRVFIVCSLLCVCLWAYGGQPLAGHRARGGKSGMCEEAF